MSCFDEKIRFDCKAFKQELKDLDELYGHIHLIDKHEKLPRTNRQKFLEAGSTLDHARSSRRFKNEPNGHFKPDNSMLSKALLTPRYHSKSQNDLCSNTSKISKFLADTNSFNLKKGINTENSTRFIMEPRVKTYCKPYERDLHSCDCKPFNPYSVCGGNCYMENRSRYKRTIPSYVPLYLKNPLMREGFGYSEGDDLIDPKVVANSCCVAFCDFQNTPSYKQSCKKKRIKENVKPSNKIKDQLAETLSFARTIKRKTQKQLFNENGEGISDKQQQQQQSYAQTLYGNVSRRVSQTATLDNVRQNNTAFEGEEASIQFFPDNIEYIEYKQHVGSRVGSKPGKPAETRVHSSNVSRVGSKPVTPIETRAHSPYSNVSRPVSTPGTPDETRIHSKNASKVVYKPATPVETRAHSPYSNVSRVVSKPATPDACSFEQIQADDLDNSQGISYYDPKKSEWKNIYARDKSDVRADRESIRNLENIDTIPCEQPQEELTMHNINEYVKQCDDHNQREWKNIQAKSCSIDDPPTQRFSLKNMETVETIPCQKGDKKVVIKKGYLDNGEEIYKAQVES